MSFYLACAGCLFVGVFLGICIVALLQAGRDRRPLGDPEIGRLINKWEGRKRE
jgi:NhaP-type Na+/H+ or K+/H+ antiporter